MGTAGDSPKSIQIDREERQQGTSEERIRLVVPRLPLGHESSKTPEFSTEWMVNQAQQVVQKLSGAVHRILLSNCTWQGGTPRPTYKKPFDILAREIERGTWGE